MSDPNPATNSTILTLAIGVIVPALTAIIGWQAGNNSINKDYVQIASQIAQSKDSPKPLKKWAAKLLNEMSPVPFDQGVEDSIAVYPASDPTYESFIFLPKNFLESDFAKPCRNFDSILHKKEITTDEAVQVANAYKSCEFKHAITIDAISKMKTVSDEIAEKNRKEDSSARERAGNPFSD